jgi:voltage-gated sodium channel
MGGFRASVGPIATTCRRIADDTRFQTFIFGVIFCNAVTLGLGTYQSIEADVGSLLTTLDDIFVGIYVVELTIRILAFGTRPQDFFKDGWNVFDFVVITAAFLPGVRENVTLLRLARLLRVTRLVSVFPDLRVLVRAMARSLPPIGSLLVLTLLLMFAYGMVGWILFHEQLPKDWGTIGDAMLTLFVMLTLENWPSFLEQGQNVHPASWIFFVSYILIAAFLVINILLAIIINSMEEVREVERQRERAKRHRDAEQEGPVAEAALAAESADAIATRLEALRDALDDLETDLRERGHSDSRAPRQQVTTKARLRP